MHYMYVTLNNYKNPNLDSVLLSPDAGSLVLKYALNFWGSVQTFGSSSNPCTWFAF